MNGESYTGTILYIEDNSFNIKLVEKILSQLRPKIKLITNVNGEKAIHLAIEHQPDLILLDLNLPDIHGTEVVALLQAEEKTKAIPVVVYSTEDCSIQKDKLFSAGIKNYLSKPTIISDFLNVIDENISS